MKTIEVLLDPTALARRGAELIADAADAAVRDRGRFTLALSGGGTPDVMFEEMSRLQLPWAQTHIFQVDERVAPDGHSDRNWVALRARLVENAPLPAANVHPMPVTAPDLEAAAMAYATEIADLCGTPAVLDLVHLGIGDDGHTASLTPGDPILRATEDVGVSQEYRGRVRMTFTYPLINRARSILWLVSGPDKIKPLRGLIDGDDSLPASGVRSDRATLLVDELTAGDLDL
jgi:6-phosphogluconolactonase